MFPQYSSNMSLVDPKDLNVMGNTGGLYGSAIPGMNNELMGLAKALPNQAAQGATQPTGMSEMDMFKLAAGALQGMGKNQQSTQMPQLPIMRDQNQFRFAGMQQNPQMLANALRNR